MTYEVSSYIQLFHMCPELVQLPSSGRLNIRNVELLIHTDLFDLDFVG
jgi:hypothetical protein